MKTFETSSAEETRSLGERFARTLCGNETIAFYGEPGAGKTVFSKGIAEGIGVTELVTSPTFTILNVYEGKFPLYHYDMYRISELSELEEVGFFENLGGGITLVEWAENIGGALPADAIRIRVEGSGEKRKITIYEDIEL